MTNTSHKNPHYALRIEETTMDKLKYIAGHNGRSANKEIEQLILAHIASYERAHGPIFIIQVALVLWSISKISIYSISGLYEGHGLEDAAYLVVEAIVDDRAAILEDV